MSIPPGFCEQHGEVEPCLTCKQEREKELRPPKRPALISERDMVILIRAALLGIVDALEKRYGIKPSRKFQ